MKKSKAKLKKLNAPVFEKTQIKTLQLNSIKGGGLTSTMYPGRNDYANN